MNETYTVVLKTITETNAFERDMDMRARAYSDPVIKFNASVDPVADGLSYEEARASNVNVISPVSVPEPGTLFVFSLGILGLIIRRAF